MNQVFQQGDRVYFYYAKKTYEGEFRGRRHGTYIILTEDGERYYIKKARVRPKGFSVPHNVPRLDPVAETSLGVIEFN